VITRTSRPVLARRARLIHLIAAASAVCLAVSLPAEAQTQPRPRTTAAPARRQPASSFGVRGFVDFGATTFTAKDSFEAVLGKPSGPIIGGGGEVRLPGHVFVSLRGSRFSADGERVFVSGGQTFPLGIATTISVTPIELTGGYRFVRRGWAFVPYGGAGIGWHRYRETSEFADASENVSLTATGYHVMGGVDVPVRRWISGAFEVQWSRVPDAIGGDANSVAQAFGESDLGGITARVKAVVGF
jgi:opacity protein-like surface antigen